MSETGNGGITALRKATGLKFRARCLQRAVISSRFFSYKLGLGESDNVYVLHRIRYGNDEPIAVEYTYLPKGIFRA